MKHILLPFERQRHTRVQNLAHGKAAAEMALAEMMAQKLNGELN